MASEDMRPRSAADCTCLGRGAATRQRSESTRRVKDNVTPVPVLQPSWRSVLARPPAQVVPSHPSVCSQPVSGSSESCLFCSPLSLSGKAPAAVKASKAVRLQEQFIFHPVSSRDRLQKLWGCMQARVACPSPFLQPQTASPVKSQVLQPHPHTSPLLVPANQDREAWPGWGLGSWASGC